jgi:hypothetical protein
MFENVKEGDVRFRLYLNDKASQSFTTLADAIKAFLETRARKAFIAEEVFQRGSFVMILALNRNSVGTRSFRFTRASAKEALAKQTETEKAGV